MIEYCQLLFGIDQRDLSQIERGICEILGAGCDSDSAALNWELQFIVGRRPDR